MKRLDDSERYPAKKEVQMACIPEWTSDCEPSGSRYQLQLFWQQLTEQKISPK